MSRAVVARELEELILSAQQLCHRGMRLAEASSGEFVDPKHFRAAYGILIAAAGELHSKGLTSGAVEMHR